MGLFFLEGFIFLSELVSLFVAVLVVRFVLFVCTCVSPICLFLCLHLCLSFCLFLRLYLCVLTSILVSVQCTCICDKIGENVCGGTKQSLFLMLSGSCGGGAGCGPCLYIMGDMNPYFDGIDERNQKQYQYQRVMTII